MKTITIQISRNSAPPPSGDLFVHVLSTWDQFGKSRPTYKGSSFDTLGLPDAWRYRPRDLQDSSGNNKPDFVSLDADNNNAWHYLLKINLEVQWGRTIEKAEYFEWFKQESSQKDTMVQTLESLLKDDRCYTNFDNRKWQHILTGRYTGKALMDDPQTATKRTLSGVGECYGFYCIDASQDLWQFSPMRPSDRHLFEEPLSTGRVVGYNAGGAYIVRDDLHKHFPQFGGRCIVPIWLPMDSVAWIPTSQCIIQTAAQASYNKVFLEV